MKKVVPFFVATVCFAMILASFGFVGLIGGNIIGERVFRNPEPMLESGVGVLCGVVVGIVLGVLGSITAYRTTSNLIGM